MYAALNQQGQLVYASQVSELERFTGQWRCPYCDQALSLREGPKVKAHFVHVTGPCGQQRQRKLPLESALHQVAKQRLAQAFQAQGEGVSLEYYIRGTGQYADLCLPQRRWVLEYQQSIIPATDLAKRQAAYEAEGLAVTWILAAQAVRPPLKTRWKEANVYYHPDWGYYWLALDVGEAALLHTYGLPLVYSRLAYRHMTRRLSLKALAQEPWREQLLDYTSWGQGVSQAYRELAHPLNESKLLAYYSQSADWRQLYQAGLGPQLLPRWCLQGQYQVLLSSQAGWVWLAHQATFLRQRTSFSQSDWLAYHQSLITDGQLRIGSPPLLSPQGQASYLPLVSQSWLRLWQHQGYVTIGDQGEVRVSRLP